ncbi:MAG: putative sulfate exporter family transporter [Planctomycetes bacterium]|nr:putative sulfate exporter family transporter [Planctomycetota bacterium]
MRTTERLLQKLAAAGPGLGVVFGIAAAAVLAKAAGVPWLDPTALALLFGLAASPWLPDHHRNSPGVPFAGRAMLRLGVVLSGWRLALVPREALAPLPLLLVAALVGTTLLAGRWLGRRLRLAPDLGLLLAAGHAICGASAIAATASVVRSRDGSAATAIVLVTLAGTGLMLGLPALAVALPLSPEAAGAWAGASLHEVAQALAAGQRHGDAGVATATVFKLARVLFLVPLVLLLPRLCRSSDDANATLPHAARAPRPWFVLGFALVGAASLTGAIPTAAQPFLRAGQDVTMLLAMGALGLMTPLRTVAAIGWRPLASTLLLTAFVTLAGLALALLVASPPTERAPA